MATIEPIPDEELDKMILKFLEELVNHYPLLRICDLRWIVERTQHEIHRKMTVTL